MVVWYYSHVRRSPAFRLLTALWALWFAVALIEPTGIHQCPVHGNAAAADMGSMAGMDMGGMSMSHDQAHQGDQSQHSAQCTCLSQCCSAPSFVASKRATIPERIVALAAERPFADAPCPAIERTHALPFANGPPPLASA